MKNILQDCFDDVLCGMLSVDGGGVREGGYYLDIVHGTVYSL